MLQNVPLQGDRVLQGSHLVNQVKWLARGKPPARHACTVAADLLLTLLGIVGRYPSLRRGGGDFMDMEIFDKIRADHDFLQYLDSVDELAEVSLIQLVHEERVAFFVNCYNLLMLHSAVCSKAPSNPLKRLKFFMKYRVHLGELGLVNSVDIEHAILRAPLHLPNSFVSKLFKLPKYDPGSTKSIMVVKLPEPRISFAICCGARSSPAVQVYDPGKLDQQLCAATQAYLKGAVHVHLDRGSVVVPQVVEWYKADFVDPNAPNQNAGLLAALSKYCEPVVQAQINQILQQRPEPGLKYAAYDWTFFCYKGTPSNGASTSSTGRRDSSSSLSRSSDHRRERQDMRMGRAMQKFDELSVSGNRSSDSPQRSMSKLSQLSDVDNWDVDLGFLEMDGTPSGTPSVGLLPPGSRPQIKNGLDLMPFPSSDPFGMSSHFRGSSNRRTRSHRDRSDRAPRLGTKATKAASGSSSSIFHGGNSRHEPSQSSNNSNVDGSASPAPSFSDWGRLGLDMSPSMMIPQSPGRLAGGPSTEPAPSPAPVPAPSPDLAAARPERTREARAGAKKKNPDRERRRIKEVMQELKGLNFGPLDTPDNVTILQASSVQLRALQQENAWLKAENRRFKEREAAMQENAQKQPLPEPDPQSAPFDDLQQMLHLQVLRQLQTLPEGDPNRAVLQSYLLQLSKENLLTLQKKLRSQLENVTHAM